MKTDQSVGYTTFILCSDFGCIYNCHACFVRIVYARNDVVDLFRSNSKESELGFYSLTVPKQVDYFWQCGQLLGSFTTSNHTCSSHQLCEDACGAFVCRLLADCSRSSALLESRPFVPQPWFFSCAHCQLYSGLDVHSVPLLQGHRGVWVSNIAENTYEAVDAATAAGWNMTEVDIRQSKDKRLVVMHDLSVRRTTVTRAYKHNSVCTKWISFSGIQRGRRR